LKKKSAGLKMSLQAGNGSILAVKLRNSVPKRRDFTMSSDLFRARVDQRKSTILEGKDLKESNNSNYDLNK